MAFFGDVLRVLCAPEGFNDTEIAFGTIQMVKLNWKSLRGLHQTMNISDIINWNENIRTKNMQMTNSWMFHWHISFFFTHHTSYILCKFSIDSDEGETVAVFFFRLKQLINVILCAEISSWATTIRDDKCTVVIQTHTHTHIEKLCGMQQNAKGNVGTSHH